MAVAAFKSTSRRAARNAAPSTPSSDKETTKQYHPTSPKKGSSSSSSSRRSRSVSAVPRSHVSETSTSSTATSDFLIKRDNPLYWTTVSPPDKDKDNEIVVENEFKTAPTNAKSPTFDDRRGRSVSRNADVVKNVSGIGRSLSRVDTGRRGRSVSRGPVSRGHFVNPESDVEQDGSLLMKYTNRNDSNTVSNVKKKSDLVRRSSDTIDQMKNLPNRTDGSAINLPSSPNRSWEDGVLGSSFSEAEERTIKAVCDQVKSLEGDKLEDDTSSRIYETVRSEVKRAIADIQNDLETAMRRSNAAVIATANVTDIPPDLVNPSAVELVLDIRREYANKLEQSLERARKLRADLAVEEHRGLELSRILKEVLPDPQTSNVQKSRPGRKSSIERRKMSKRLTEEAMAYFDECVSLSTFDSSDFSSQEDPPIKLVGGAAPVGDRASFSQASSSIAANCCPKSGPIDKQESSFMFSRDPPVLSTSGSSKEPTLEEVSPNSLETRWGWRSQFSFARKPNDTFELQQDIRNYAKNFEKDLEKVNINSQISRSTCCDLDEYNLQASSQSLLFDRVFFNNRLDSGSMLLCDGGIAISLSPFASLI